VRTPAKKVGISHENLKLIQGDFTKDDAAIQETIKCVTYVISTVSGASNRKDYEPFFIAAFIEKLWPMLNQPKPKFFSRLV
jgi:hypothetical protein